MRIFAFHLLNDYSGSPKVLMQLAKIWVKNGRETHIVTASGREGFLSNIPGVQYHFYWYKWAANPLFRLINLSISQCLLLIKMMFHVKKNDVVYINTVLPFGAAFLGKLIGCRVIYHIHETTMKPRILKRFLFGTAKWAAHDVVYVSQYLSEQEPFPRQRKHILLNAIEPQFLEKAAAAEPKAVPARNVLMICSLKWYKGVQEFVKLAVQNPEFHFNLIMNASMAEINAHFENTVLPSNLTAFDTQTNLHPFFQWSDVVLNLSRPDGWVETFGLTILEGMAYGRPAIVPPVGGIAELVEDGVTGFHVDCRNTDLLNQKLRQLLCNPADYCAMSAAAKAKLLNFQEQAFGRQSLDILESGS